MSNQDNYLKILDKLETIHVSMGKVELKTDLLTDDVKQIKLEDAEQNRLLAEHIAGVKTNKARLEEEKRARQLVEEDMNKRLDKLEATPKLYALLSSKIMKISGLIAAVAGAAVAVYKLAEYI